MVLVCLVESDPLAFCFLPLSVHSLTVLLLPYYIASLSNAMWQLFLKRHTSFISHRSARMTTHFPFPATFPSPEGLLTALAACRT